MLNPRKAATPLTERVQAGARASFEAVGLTPDPTVPYRNSGTPWPSTCHAAGHPVAPTLGNVRHRNQGCDECARTTRGLKRRLDGEVAAAVMRSAGFEPLEPYPGNSGTRWRSRCLTRSAEVFPTLDNVRGHGHTCTACRTHGLDWDGPAQVYLLEHPVWHALKIGVAKVVLADGSPARAARLSRIYGWRLVRVLRCATGREAFTIEQRVLRWWRDGLGLPSYLGPEETEGHTETVDAEVGVPAVWARVLAEARRGQGRLDGTNGGVAT